MSVLCARDIFVRTCQPCYLMKNGKRGRATEYRTRFFYRTTFILPCLLAKDVVTLIKNVGWKSVRTRDWYYFICRKRDLKKCFLNTNNYNFFFVGFTISWNWEYRSLTTKRNFIKKMVVLCTRDIFVTTCQPFLPVESRKTLKGWKNGEGWTNFFWRSTFILLRMLRARMLFRSPKTSDRKISWCLVDTISFAVKKDLKHFLSTNNRKNFSFWFDNIYKLKIQFFDKKKTHFIRNENGVTLCKRHFRWNVSTFFSLEKRKNVRGWKNIQRISSVDRLSSWRVVSHEYILRWSKTSDGKMSVCLVDTISSAGKKRS